jgi:predicted TIM-barrel fold metal-dependent hydrolase
MLEGLRQKQYVGLSLYLFWDESEEGPLLHVSAEVWEWLVHHRWLISVNSRGERWSAWYAVLERHPDLRLLVSHLGLPPARSEADMGKRVKEVMEPVLGLAKYPGVHVKLSGFYALTEPNYAYPHRPAWPYVEALLKTFGSSRLLWASDFSPCLEWVSFPQTLGLLAEMPFLDAEDRRRIEGENLLVLLQEVACA